MYAAPSSSLAPPPLLLLPCSSSLAPPPLLLQLSRMLLLLSLLPAPPARTPGDHGSCSCSPFLLLPSSFWPLDFKLLLGFARCQPLAQAALAPFLVGLGADPYPEPASTVSLKRLLLFPLLCLLLLRPTAAPGPPVAKTELVRVVLRWHFCGSEVRLGLLVGLYKMKRQKIAVHACGGANNRREKRKVAYDY